MQTPSKPPISVLVVLFDTPDLGVIRITTQKKRKERGKITCEEDE